MPAVFFGAALPGVARVRPGRREPTKALNGVAPPGWEKTIKKMKQSMDIDNPWALSWWLKRQGAHPAMHDADASLDEQIAAALTMLARHDLPAVCYAAARGEQWAQAELLASAGQAYIRSAPR